MSTLREHVDEVLSEIGWALAHDHDIKRSGQLWIEHHLQAVVAILDFKPLDSDLPPTPTRETA